MAGDVRSMAPLPLAGEALEHKEGLRAEIGSTPGHATVMSQDEFLQLKGYVM